MTLADQIFAGTLAESKVEAALDLLWPDLVHHIGHDGYDNSLEIYFDGHAPADLRATEAEAYQIFELGFSACWLNFTDGTEQQLSNVWLDVGLYVGARQAVLSPSWTLEKLRQLEGRDSLSEAEPQT